MTLENKHLVIAGGSSGIGFAIAQAALTQGARVTLVGRSAEKLEAAAQRLPSSVGLGCFDLGDAEAARSRFQAIGGFDHFVSTAADLTYGPLASMQRPAIERMVAGKFWGPINFVQHGLQHLNKDGSVLLFSGLAADRPGSGTSMVSALNAGVEGLVRALAIELAPIRVNGISPGVVDTEGWSFMPDESRQAFFADLGAKLPAGRVGRVDDLANASLFALLNPYLTGEIIHVNGGGSLI